MLAACAAALAGCSGDSQRTFGFSRDAPDEFTVTTRAPLAMPPSFALPPPTPGVSRPQELSDAQKARAGAGAADGAGWAAGEQ